MVIFLLSALLAFLVCRWIAAIVLPLQPNRVQRAIVWIVDRWRGLMIVLAAIALGGTFYALLSGSDSWQIVHAARQIALAPETAQVLLGALAGWLCHMAPGWLKTPEPRRSGALDPSKEKMSEGTWRLIIFSAGIAVVTLMALIAPYGPRMLGRITGVEISGTKIQLSAGPADAGLLWNAERDLVSLEQIADLPQTWPIIQYECGYEVLTKGGIKAFETDPKLKERHQLYALALAQRNPQHSQLTRFIVQVANARLEGYDRESLRARIAPVAAQFYVLMTSTAGEDPQAYAKQYANAMAALTKAAAEFKNEGINDHFPPLKIESWCVKPAEKEITAEQFQRLASNTRYAHGVVAALLLFSGNTERAKRLMSNVQEKARPHDINVTVTLGELAYLTDLQDIRAAVPRWDSALQSVERQAKEIDQLALRDPRDEELRNRVRFRYERARALLKREAAYVYAQAEVDWPTALDYAHFGYQSFRNSTWKRLDCLDDEDRVAFGDTYAYVNLLHQAYLVKVRKTPADLAKVREAKWILEDLKSYLRSADDKRPCLDAERRRIWYRKVVTHLDLAEKILQLY